MNDETRVAEELYAFARALVGKIAHRRRGEHWKEDAVQDLVLAGLQDYRDTGDIGLAKNRMVSRQKNLLRDAESERRHEPKPESDFLPAVTTPGDDGVLEAGTRRDDPVETALVRDFLGHLPERRGRVCLRPGELAALGLAEAGLGAFGRDLAADRGVERPVGRLAAGRLPVALLGRQSDDLLGGQRISRLIGRNSRNTFSPRRSTR